MMHRAGKALPEFEALLAQFRRVLAESPEIHEAVFEGAQDWADLLTYKLVPHLAGQGCLVAAVAGGTNTGKSTIFNLLVGGHVSPVVTTAAATCHPVLAANARRHAECLESKLVPEFRPRPLDRPELALDRDAPSDTLCVALVESLPDHLVILDTPDVDSIDTGNWEIADHLRAAGDALIAVVTGEKYKDERVVEFFREALAAGRVVLPLMNKADPAEDFGVARKQMAEFRADVGLEGPCFVVPHDFRLAERLDTPVRALDGGPDLRTYLEQLDVPAIKERVFRGTIRRFVDRGERFLDRAAEFGRGIADVIRGFEHKASAAARRYDPLPGAAVGGLFHEFVQSKRGAVRRLIGTTSATVVRTTTALGRRVGGALRRRATFDAGGAAPEEALDKLHRRQIERIARDLAADYIETARALPRPLGPVVTRAIEVLDLDEAVAGVVADVVRSDNVSDEFRAHARRTLETWWEDHRGRRRVLEALDILLAVTPAAIAAPIAMHTGGLGAPEAIVALGPLATQFVTRVMEYQFGDAMFDFLSPWKKEQQERLEEALRARLAGPCLAPLARLIGAFEGPDFAEMRRLLDLCRRP